MTQTGVSEEEIGQECTRKELDLVARHIPKWLSYAKQLCLTEQDIEHIRTGPHSDVRMKAVAVLQRWQENNGHSATYKLLTQACLDLGDVDVAEIICTVMQKTY